MAQVLGGWFSLETVCQSERKRGMGRTYTQNLPPERFRQNRDGDLIWNITSEKKNNAIKAQMQKNKY